jgi:hypothetical protein
MKLKNAPAMKKSLEQTEKQLFDATSNFSAQFGRADSRNPEDVSASDEEIKAFRERRASMARQAKSLSSEGPVSALGGVGVGVFFNDGVFTFEKESSISWFAIAPARLGGKPQRLLYLTSTNHASKGCEALFSYQYGAESVFRIWDWAAPTQPNGSQFVKSMTRSQLRDYLHTTKVGGVDIEGVHITNYTKLAGGNNWRNSVFLYNYVTKQFDLIWWSKFNWDPTPADKYVNWGPMIETFDAADYGTTNPIGYLAAELNQDGARSLLLPENSFIWGGGGFEVRHLVPNHTLTAD